MQNALKAKLHAGQPALNAWLSIGNPFTAEIMATSGYDSCTIDWQHGALDYADILPMLQAMHGHGVTPMARVPWLDAGAIMKALDAGVMGVICPMINTGQDAAEFASYMRYPPRGQRSFGPTRAAIADPEYSVEANDHVLALAMIETASGYENCEEIVATDGIDGVYIGPADLTLGTQQGRLPPGLDRAEPEMTQIIRDIQAICAKHGKFAGIHCGSVEYAKQAIDWGFNLTTVGGDTRFLSQGARSSVRAWRQAVGQDGDTTERTQMY